MIIYEVNLLVKFEVYKNYEKWLLKHIDEMLELNIFSEAQLYFDAEDPLRLTVHYKVASQKQLNEYLSKYASKMREEGLKKFQGMFSATRRVLVEKGRF